VTESENGRPPAVDSGDDASDTTSDVDLEIEELRLEVP
jgi:hypothetical protein